MTLNPPLDTRAAIAEAVGTERAAQFVLDRERPAIVLLRKLRLRMGHFATKVAMVSKESKSPTAGFI